FFGCLDQVASVGVADPADRGAAVHGAGQHFDLVGDEESGEQPDSELAEEFVAGVAELVAFAGPADSGEEFVDLRFGQAHPGVVDPQAAFTGVFGVSMWIRAGASGSSARRAVTASTPFCSSSRR